MVTGDDDQERPAAGPRALVQEVDDKQEIALHVYTRPG